MYIINAIRQAGGQGHEHITRVRYEIVSHPGGVYEADVSEMVDAIMIKRLDVMSKGRHGAPNAMVYVNRNQYRAFIESRADSTPNNNLLSQPRY